MAARRDVRFLAKVRIATEPGYLLAAGGAANMETTAGQARVAW
jgi:hypothetical protein